MKFKTSIVRNIRPEIRLAVYRALSKITFDVKHDVLLKFTNLKLGAKKTTITLYRKKVLETRIEARI